MSHRVFNSDSESDTELLEETSRLGRLYKDQAQGQEDGERLLAESEEDSEDDAPEDVGFVLTKKSALEQLKDALSQIREGKDQMKLKRKQRDENYKLQKKKKLEELEKKKLPADLLESLSSKSLKKKKVELSETNEEGEKETETSDIEERLHGSEEEHEEEEDENFIAIDKNAGIEVVTMKESKKKLMTSSEAAADFRDQRLYGKGVNRKPVSSLLAIKRKRRARFL